MKVASLQLALTTLAIGFNTAGRAADDMSAVSNHDLQAKMYYCKTCHGLSGQGFRAYYAIPRLAGQQTKYIENQVRAFAERRRTNNIMFNVSHVLSPAMLTALATNFHDLNPKPLGGAPKELVAAGKKIYEEGVPDAGVPSCTTCHGQDAKGDQEFPRLAGQLHEYTINKLTNWNKERDQDPAKPNTSAVMDLISRGLTESQIKAIAAYVSSLE
jgi:cytochrome c553